MKSTNASESAKCRLISEMKSIYTLESAECRLMSEMKSITPQPPKEVGVLPHKNVD